MNLVLDIGNTRIKAAIFEQKKLVQYKVFNNTESLSDDSEFYAKARNVIISSVVELPPDELPFIKQFDNVIHFSSHTKIPIKNLYKTSSTLGSDRLAAAVGANRICSNKNVLSVDTGTCLKFNFVNENNEYLGGAISPGLQMRLKALNYYTGKLPLVTLNESFHELIGTSTCDSILSGVINGIILETDGVINEYKKHYPDLTILVSGGDTAFFVNRLKNCIFAHPHLVLQGLNEVLIYNS